MLYVGYLLLSRAVALALLGTTGSDGEAGGGGMTETIEEAIEWGLRRSRGCSDGPAGVKSVGETERRVLAIDPRLLSEMGDN